MVSAFLCLGCGDQGDGCPTCRPANPDGLLLLASLIAIVAGIAIAVLSCRSSWRWL